MSAPAAPAEVDAERVAALLPRPGCLLLAIPVVMVALTFAAYVVIFGLGQVGRPVSGPEVELVVAGCEEALPVIRARLDDMGLEAGPPAGAGPWTLRTRLPFRDTDPAVFAATLAAPGRFAMADGDEILATEADIAYAGVRMDLVLTPSTLVRLDDAGRDRVYARMRAEPDGTTRILLDGVEVWRFGNRRSTSNGEFEIPPDAEDDAARMALAARRGVILNHGPLPCPTEVRVRPVDP